MKLDTNLNIMGCEILITYFIWKYHTFSVKLNNLTKNG